MTEDQWKIVRENTEALRAERDHLRWLVNAARLAMPQDHSLQPALRKALGLAPQPQQDQAA